MSSIKIKDDTGNWVYFGGTAQDTDLLWIDINSSTFYIPATGGNFSVTTAAAPNFVLGVLPLAPANGTTVRTQVIDIVKPCYLQPQSPDTIDYQLTTVVAQVDGNLPETVRYRNGRWLRIEGTSIYQAI
jgi:hypothetical protein